MTEALGDVHNASGEARKRDPTSGQPEPEPETEKTQGKRPETELELAQRASERQQETDPESQNVAAGTAPREEPEVKQTRV